MNWGNLCSCMRTVISPLPGYRACFRPRINSVPSELIEWDLENREPFGECKSFDFLGACVCFQYEASFDSCFPVYTLNESPRDPESDEVIYTRITPQPRIPSRRGSPALTMAGSPSGASTPIDPTSSGGMGQRVAVPVRSTYFPSVQVTQGQ